MKKGIGSWLRGLGRIAICVAICIPSLLQAASLTVSSGSTSSGTFTLSWTAGYNLRLQDATWEFASAPTTSQAFSGLPPGTYKFEIVSCVPQYQNVGGFQIFIGTACFSTAPTPTTLVASVNRDTETAIDTNPVIAGTSQYVSSTTTRGSSAITVPLTV